MSKVSNLLLSIQEDVDSGLYTAQQIADFHGIPVSWVWEAMKIEEIE